MNRQRTVALAAVLLFGTIVALRILRSATPAPSAFPEIPASPAPAAPEPPPERIAIPRPLPPAPSRLLPFLESLGRARVVRDRRNLDQLRKDHPPVFESDSEWIFSRLGGELFESVGAAELIRWFGFRSGVPHLASALGQPGHAFLKDVVIDTLAALGGDAAEAAILGSLASDPDDSIRLRSANALAAFRGPEAYQGLVRALRDPSPRVRSQASDALAQMGSKEVLDAFLAALRDERDPAAQASLIASIYRSGGEEAATVAARERPAALEILFSQARLRSDARYRRAYESSFFEPGGSRIPFDPSKRKIGITLDLGSGLSPKEIALVLFGAAPLDRYRDWFYFRKADDFPEPTAYDSGGNRAEDIPFNDLDGTVFLHFRDPRSFSKGVLGYTKGCDAFVQGVSVLHEFGHAFARLGDEYSDGSHDDAANLSRRAEVPWMPLVQARLLGSPPRRDAEFLKPSESCYLNNDPAPSRYCPVCQLEIIARVSELTDAPFPW